MIQLNSRISHYFQCSYECFVCSLAYIDLLLQNKSFVLNAYSIHRVILVTFAYPFPVT